MAELRKVVVVRPGALGDVVVARGLLTFLKCAFPAARLVLLAPGERGRWMAEAGWVDAAYDLDRREFSWLFLESGLENPGADRVMANVFPEPLCEVFETAGLIISFTGAESKECGRLVGANLRRLARGARVWCGEPYPAGGMTGGGVVRWLAQIGAEVCASGGLLGSAPVPNLDQCLSRRCSVEAGAFPVPFGGGGYLLMHPGSGSPRKNWPAKNFASLARALLSWGEAGGAGERSGAAFSGLALLSGEADGGLADEVRELAGTGVVFRGLSLGELSILLSRAYLYVGNDSGVSHMSCAVRAASGSYPRSAVIFGPSDAGIWGEEESLQMLGGRDFSHLPVSTALGMLSRFLIPLSSRQL